VCVWHDIPEAEHIRIIQREISRRVGACYKRQQWFGVTHALKEAVIENVGADAVNRNHIRCPVGKQAHLVKPLTKLIW